MSEDQELLARISHLAGQINRHKNNSGLQSSNGVVRHQHFSRSRASNHRLRSFGHRNRSLVLNQGEHSPLGTRPSDGSAESPSWVSKQGRHLQLINTSIYDKETQLRSRSSSRPGDKDGSGRESGEDQDIDPLRTPLTPRVKPTASTLGHYLEIEGITFQVCEGGRKLLRTKGGRLPAHRRSTLTSSADAETASIATPDKVVISKVEFQRTPKGDLERSEPPAAGCALPQSAAQTFLTAARHTPRDTRHGLCKRFSNTGQCPRGPRCAHIHDPSKVAICRDFLREGKCPNGAHCDLSHDCSYERVPACSHFQRGKCTKADCRYAHVRVNPAADVCRAFSTYGFCVQGSLCQERHVFECPDYASTGTCPNQACRLPHIDRAGRLRLSTTKNVDAMQRDSSASTSEEARASDPDDDSITDDVTMKEETLVPLAGHEQQQQLSQQDDFVRF